MSTSDLEITKAYPAVEYNATETPLGVYREDREIDGQMWRTYNASFNGSTWSYITTGLTVAYALVQNTDGSISFFTYIGATGWSTSSWTGSDNHTIFNAVDFGLRPGTSADSAANAWAIQNALNAAAALGSGGRILIPSGIFVVDTTTLMPNPAITVPTTDPKGNAIGIIIEGATMGSELAQQAGTLNIFYITGDNNSKAVLIKNLRFSYAAVNVSGSTQPFAVYSLSPNVVCELCYFANCPAMYMAGNHNGLLACEINYAVNASTDTNNAVMVYVTGADDFITECRISQNSVGHDSGATGCIAIQVGTADEPRFDNINISDFDYGIDIPGGGNEGSSNLIHAMFSNVSCECNRLRPELCVTAIA